TDGCGANAGCVLGFLGYPTISSINPTSANVGQDVFYLHVMGTGFTVDEAKTKPTALWNGKPIETAPLNSKNLDARIENAYVAQPGPVSVSVQQFEIDEVGDVTRTLLTSNAVTFTVNGPEPDCPGAIRPHTHDPRYFDVNDNRWKDTGL